MSIERTHQGGRARWQEYVRSKAYYLENEQDRLCARECQDAQDTGYVKAATTTHLRVARHSAGLTEDGRADLRLPRRHRMVNAWTGAAVEGAFVNLHAAEVVLANLYSEQDVDSRVPDVLARMRATLPPDDPRRVKAELLLGARSGEPAGPSERRVGLRDAMRVAYDAADELHARVRSFRNVLIVSAVVLTVLVLIVGAVGIVWPKTIPLCFQPSFTAPGSPPQPLTIEQTQSFACPSSTGRSVPHSGDVPIVALMGLLGGALSATFGIQKLRGTSTPYAIPVALSFMKLPAGALTGIVGLVLVHGEFVPGLSELDSQGQILAYAVALGVAQHLFTRFVDRRAETVLNSLPSKEGTTATGESTAAKAAESTATGEVVEA
jgi:hypothetical protein